MSNVSVYKWQVFCEDEGKYVTGWSETKPTKCFTNTAHTITDSKTIIIATRDPDTIKIREEDTPTNGNFRTTVVRITSPANSSVSQIVTFEHPINILSAAVITTADQEGDLLEVTVSPNTTVGILTNGITAANEWQSQNYVVNDIVYYPSTNRNYKCKLNTVNNEPPTNTTYWSREHLVLNVNSTVTDNILPGFKVKLFDGVNTNELGWVRNVNKDAGTITVSEANTNNFSAMTTYVIMTIVFADVFEFGPPGIYDVGGTRIGAAYMPADVPVYFTYTNKSLINQRTLRIQVDFLY